jgi:hypothetical protein
VSHNALDALPELGSLVCLRHLFAHSNRLAALPASMGELRVRALCARALSLSV